MNALVAVVSRVYALSMAAHSRRLRLVTVCPKRLIVSATWVTCSVLVVAVWLLPLLDAGVPGVSSEKTFLCSHPSLCLSTWGVVCLALMYVVTWYGNLAHDFQRPSPTVSQRSCYDPLNLWGQAVGWPINGRSACQARDMWPCRSGSGASA